MSRKRFSSVPLLPLIVAAAACASDAAEHPGTQCAVDSDLPHPERVDGQTLRREHVSNMRCADSEGHGAERSVR